MVIQMALIKSIILVLKFWVLHTVLMTLIFFQVFDWDRSIQDTILSSFFWGYIILQIPAGMLAGKFGGKSLILCSMLSNGVVNLFVPLAASKVRSLCFIVIFLININKYFHCGRGT